MALLCMNAVTCFSHFCLSFQIAYSGTLDDPDSVIYRYRLAFREFDIALSVQCSPAAQPAWQDMTRSLDTFW